MKKTGLKTKELFHIAQDIEPFQIENLTLRIAPLKAMMPSPLKDLVTNDQPLTIFYAQKDIFGDSKEWEHHLKSPFRLSTAEDGNTQVTRGTHEVSGSSLSHGNTIQIEGVSDNSPFKYIGQQEIFSSDETVKIEASHFAGSVIDKKRGIKASWGSKVAIHGQQIGIRREEHLALQELREITTTDGHELTIYNPVNLHQETSVTSGRRDYNAEAGYLPWSKASFPTMQGQINLSWGAKFQGYERYTSWNSTAVFNGGSMGVNINSSDRTTIEYAKYNYLSPAGALLQKAGLLDFD